MGTRNLTIVILEKETKVAQYGQWDGYPGGVGSGILKFLTSDKFQSFKENLSKVRFIDSEGKDKEFIEEYDKNAPKWSNEPDNRTEEQKDWFKKFKTRDLAEEVLTNIADFKGKEILLGNDYSFATDSLMCEWAYVIDLDKNTFEIYEGFNKTPLNESDRFYSITKEDGGYYPIKMIKSYDLSELPTPTEFIDYFTKQEEES